MTDLLQVGVISSTHGVHGEVKVYPTTDDVNRFSDLKSVIMDPEGCNVTLSIKSVRYFKGMAIIAFDGFDSPEYAAKYKGKGLFVTREQALPLEEDEFYIADLIGMQVKLENGETFGEITEVYQTGANDVYSVLHEGKDILIPAIRSCILDVDLQSNTMTIHLLNGLLD